jgi:hypothetical protein
MPKKFHPINNPLFEGFWPEEDRKAPFSHGACSCSTMDLSTPVIIEALNPKDVINVAKEYGNMIAFHMTYILPHLNGFRGYDCTEIKVKKI